MSDASDTIALWLMHSLHAGISVPHAADGNVSGEFAFGGQSDYHIHREKAFFRALNVILNNPEIPTNIYEIDGIRIHELLLIVRTLKMSRDVAFDTQSVRDILHFSERAIANYVNANSRTVRESSARARNESGARNAPDEKKRVDNKRPIDRRADSREPKRQRTGQ